MNSIFDDRRISCFYYLLWRTFRTPRVPCTPMYISLLRKDYISLNIQLREYNSFALKKKDSCTLLHSAAASGDIKAIEILLAHRFDPNASYVERVKDISRVNEVEVTVTPLFLAVISGNEDAIMMLREAGACMEDLKSNNHWALLLTLTISWGKTELFEELLNYTDSLDERDPNGMSYAEMSIVSEKENILQVLLDRGVDVNDQNNTERNTPLHVAVLCDNPYALRILCDANCRLDLKNNEGLTALCLAVENRQYDIMKELIHYDSNAEAHKSYFDDSFIRFCISDAEEEDALHWLLIFIGAKWFCSLRRLRNIKVIMEFHVKTQIAGIHFQPEFKIPEGICSPGEDFRNSCLDEIKMMKKHLLFGDTSMYSFLRASKRSLVLLASKEQVMDVFYSYIYNKKYPLYKSFLDYNFRMGQMYQPVYDRAYDSLNAATEFIFPDLVIHQILEYVDWQSMNCLIKAAELISKINIGNLHF